MSTSIFCTSLFLYLNQFKLNLCAMCSADPMSSSIACFLCLVKRLSSILLALCFSFHWHHFANFLAVKPKITLCIFTSADGLDCANVERNVLLFKEFGSKNTESVAELFVSLISKVSIFKVHLLLVFVVEITFHN